MSGMKSRILVDEERFARTLGLIGEDPGFKAGFGRLKEKADRFADESLSLDASKCGDIVDKHFTTPFDQMLTSLSFAFLAQEDQKHADAARRVMEILSRAEQWEGRWTDRVPNWRASLPTSGMSVAFAQSLSWLGDSLGSADQERYAAALRDKGIRPLMEDWVWAGSRLHALDSMGHNFWACSVGGAGFAMLACEEILPEVKDWVEDVNGSLREWLDYPGNVLQNKVPNFGHDGGYYEGQSYAMIIHFVLLFADAYRSRRGDCPLERDHRLGEMPEFFLHGVYERSKGLFSVNFGDHVSTDWIGDHGELFYAVLMRLASVFRSGLARWVAERVRPHPAEPFGFLWFDDSITARAPDKLSPCRLYRGIGWGFLRDGWGRDATLFAIKSGTTWNHAHADAGSFILWANGEQLIVDSGTANYPRKEYVNYFCQSMAHNVVLVDGRSEPMRDIYRGSRQSGRIPVLVDTPRWKYLCADASGPNCAVYQRFYRHVITVEGSFVILDDLLAHKPGVFEWLFHPAGEVTLPKTGALEGDVRTLQRSANGAPPSIEVRNGESRLRICVLHPESVDCEARQGFSEQDRALSKDVAPPAATYYALKARALHKARAAGETAFGTNGVEPELDETGREQKFIIVLSPYPEGRRRSLPILEPIEGANLKGVSLRGRGGTVEIVFNLLADGRVMHHNSINAYGSVTTDASILAVRRGKAVKAGSGELEGGASGYRMHNGSFLRVEGRPVIESPLKGDFVLDAGRDKLTLTAVSRKGFAISIGCHKEPRSVTAKPARSRPRDVRWDPRQRLLRMTMATDETFLTLRF